MKRTIHIAVIALFVTALWIPLVFTPRMRRQERAVLEEVERRDPAGIPVFEEWKQDLDPWVENIQLWYRDSFAFRSKLMALYNATHYLIRNYPAEIFGTDGHVIRRDHVKRKLRSFAAAPQNRTRNKLRALRDACGQTQTSCLFILIPSKESVHPELAPRWLRARDTSQKRTELASLIRQAGFPVLDLTPALRNAAEASGDCFFQKYDNHWNTAGALAAYHEMILFIRHIIPAARWVTEAEYELKTVGKDTLSTRQFYLDGFLSEPRTDIVQIDLPPLQIITDGVEESLAAKIIKRRTRTEVFCADREGKTVVWIRDSFLDIPSQLLNHGFAHSVYLNKSTGGRCPQAVLSRYHPDLLIFALQESSMEQYVVKIME